ncbi:MAG: copper resistance protein CopC [Geminicoccaceae bacterium]
MHRLVLLIAALAATAALPSFGSAHAFLKTAMPPVGGSLQTAPTQVIIEYSEGVEPRFSTIEVQNASGARVDTGQVRTAAGNDKRLMVGLKALQPGSYKVTWRVTSTDTHKTEGSYSFTVGR